jgi:purine-binding chemotaxis protein CheW
MQVQLCTFRVGDEEYAIDIMRIREIIRPIPVTPVPRAPEFVGGVINLRGQVIPMVDVRERFGLRPQGLAPSARFLIVKVAGGVIGLIVDGVAEVLRIQRSEIQVAPGLVGSDSQSLFLGVCGHPGERSRSGRLRMLLNVKALLRPGIPGEIAAARAAATAEAPPR